MVEALATGVLLIVLGVALSGLGVYQLGVVRAARKWPLARQPRVGRGVAGSEAALGLATTAAGGVVLTTTIRAGAGVRTGVAAGTALGILLLGTVLVVKLTDRVELNALIRSPSPLYRTTAPGPGGQYQTAINHRATTSPPSERHEHARPSAADPHRVAPPALPTGAQPGWVFTDTGGEWYLCVAIGDSHRLVRLPDFRLVAADADQRLTVAGTVELTVWPLADDSSIGEPQPGPTDRTGTSTPVGATGSGHSATP